MANFTLYKVANWPRRESHLGALFDFFMYHPSLDFGLNDGMIKQLYFIIESKHKKIPNTIGLDLKFLLQDRRMFITVMASFAILYLLNVIR